MPDIDELIDIVLLRREVDPGPNPPFPAYLASRYFRGAAVHELASVAKDDVRIQGVLLRATLLGDEEDVKTAAMRALAEARPDLIGLIAAFCQWDDDPDVRECAEELRGLAGA
jgi:hypothetical protein